MKDRNMIKDILEDILYRPIYPEYYPALFGTLIIKKNEVADLISLEKQEMGDKIIQGMNVLINAVLNRNRYEGMPPEVALSIAMDETSHNYQALIKGLNKEYKFMKVLLTEDITTLTNNVKVNTDNKRHVILFSCIVTKDSPYLQSLAFYDFEDSIKSILSIGYAEPAGECLPG